MKCISPKKLLKYFLSGFFLILITPGSQAQSLPLPREWKFRLGDNMQWANPSFNDASWKSKQIAKSWSAPGMKDNVYAWYRIKVIIPSSMKSAEKGKGIKLNLGKIDDVDQSFFNGKIIGQTGSLPPHYESEWDKERVYTIPENEVKWDKENVIAVRVFSLDSGNIGMYGGPYSFGPVEFSDFISVKHTIIETGHDGFTTKISFTNDSDYAFIGTVKYWIDDMNNKEVYSETKPVHVGQQRGSETVITFSNYQPVKGVIFKVGYLVKEDHSSASEKSEQVYLANKDVQIKVAGEPKPVIKNKIRNAFVFAPLQNQRLEGYLGERLKQNLEERLLKIHENEIMAGYLERPGNQDWVGEHVGKYLEAACNVWENTHDSRLKSQMDRMMFELINTQKKDGYLGTYAPHEYWTSWDVWSHTYNLYGLLAYYKTTGYRPALEACRKMGDLLCRTFGNKPGQRDINLSGEHEGMAATCVLDPMVTLYRYTGEKKYLDFCYYIIKAMEQQDGPRIISSLMSNGDVYKVADAKAYEMLANLVGLVNLYRLTGNRKFLDPVLIAWKDIVTHKLYITGATSSFEHFKKDGALPGGGDDHVGEGCVTVTWVELNQKLLEISGDLKYLNQAEKSIYNQLLGAENPQTGGVSYFTPLMGIKGFSCGVSCCISNVPRGISRIPFFTFGNLNKVPTLMLYGPGYYRDRVTTSEGKNVALSIQIESGFPENGNSTITLKTSRTAYFPFSLRVPSWCKSFIAKVGGKEYRGTPNQYLLIKRIWKSGDKISVSFEIPIQILKGGISYPGQIAFQRGPQVLAFDNVLNSGYLNNYPFGTGQKQLVEKPESKSVAARLPKQWIGDQAYEVSIVDKKANKSNQELILVPFADASQTGGDIKVWLPICVENN